MVKSTGPMAKANPLRFSTKYQDDETGLLYYGYRYYQPVTGRWPSRDPIQEVGTINLYEFARNKPISSIDAHGLCCSIKEFKINITGWAGGWPSWNWWGFSYTKLLNVQFQLTLNPCGKKEDCVIDQLKKGQVVRGGVLTGDFPSLVFDGDGAWWDGSSFKYGGGGWSEQTATWEDTPGFMNLKASDFPVHYDVQFRTRVKDKCSGFGVIAEIGWHLAVDFDTPTSGSYGYSY